jgi:hypothetical protein
MKQIPSITETSVDAAVVAVHAREDRFTVAV